MLARLVGRREFVRTTSGILVAATVGGCTEAGAPGSGMVRVTIVGLVGGFTTAGSATITGGALTAPLDVQLPGTASGEASVAIGTYNVVYQPPTGYTMVSGQPNEVAVVVEEGVTTEITFNVEPASGTLRVTVSGTSGTAPNAGSASALRTDIAGQSPFTINVPATGSADASVQPGTYTITYSPPANHQLASGQTNPRSVGVTTGAVGTAAFTIEVITGGGGPPPAILFHSDFSTATGTTQNALRDTSKADPWDITGGGGLEVISAAGLGFPSANVLRVTAVASATGFATVRATGMPIPAVGESRWYRCYFRAAWPDNLEDDGSHPIQDGSAGSLINWELQLQHNNGGSGRYVAAMQVHSNNPFNDFRWEPPPINRNFTYRVEWRIHRITTTTFNLHVRIFEGNATTPILDNDDFINEGGTTNLGTLPSLLFNNPANLDGLNAGCNGIGGSSPPFPFVYSYQGCFAVGTQDWIGPYSGGI